MTKNHFPEAAKKYHPVKKEKEKKVPSIPSMDAYHQHSPVDAILCTPVQPLPEPKVEVKDIKAMADNNLPGIVVGFQHIHSQHVVLVLYLLHQKASTGIF